MLPTPTGILSNSFWASSSLWGATSFSERFVRIRRTPQLISKPTPPTTRRADQGHTGTDDGLGVLHVHGGDATDGEAVATVHIGGAAALGRDGGRAERTRMTPGRVATLATCLTAGMKPPWAEPLVEQ